LRIWAAIFGVWGLFLSGLLANMGSPGIMQAVTLDSLLSAKLAQLEQVQVDVRKLEEDYARLEQSRAVQEREIRSVLGYAAPDELIFDFSDPNSL
jgi:cell division protein FtsB